MKGSNRIHTPLEFSEALFERMLPFNAGLRKLALYEFRYALDNLMPESGWDSVDLESPETIEHMIRQRAFYDAIQLKPRAKERIVLDASIARLTHMLFVGLVRGAYTEAWINKFFYFDIRGFYFLPRTVYFTDAGLAHFGGKPYRTFGARQKRFEDVQDINYWEFQEANVEIDQALIEMVQRVIAVRGLPILITLAGPTAAGKTEITERLLSVFGQAGHKTSTIEMDNFLLDREYRDGKPMGKGTIHFDLFKQCLEQILRGETITIPFYDSSFARSSHDLEGNLRPGCSPLQVEPAEIIFLEGNFPFQIPDVSDLIGLKIVYLTDDPIRLKRKWKRDVDYRKSYDPAHFRNRFFSTQFLRAEDVYRPQIEKCDIVVDTTNAAIWVTPAMATLLDKEHGE
jgi:uridine kinase